MLEMDIEQYKTIHETYFADTIGMQSKEYERLANFANRMANGDVIYFEICQWANERRANTYDYDYCVIRDGKVIRDESNGEMRLGKVIAKMFDTFGVKDYNLADYCYEDLLDGAIGCANCGHCEEW